MATPNSLLSTMMQPFPHPTNEITKEWVVQVWQAARHRQIMGLDLTPLEADMVVDALSHELEMQA